MSAHLRPVAAIVALALFATGCATPPPAPVSMRDPAVNFGNFKTFGWIAGSASRDQPVTLLDQNLRAAITAELTKRGYLPVTEKPDLLIAYETASAEKLENNPVRVGVGIGGWSGNVGGSINVGSQSVQKVKEGSLVIHAIETARNAEIWRGSVEGRLGKGTTDAGTISRAVAQAMKDFPARPAGP
jgi:hypothetical protein